MKNFMPTEEERRQEITEEIEFLRETVEFVKRGDGIENCNKPPPDFLAQHAYLVERCLKSAEDLLSGSGDLSPVEYAETLVEAATFRLLVATVWPSVLRDDTRLKGSKKPRFVEDDQWIERQLRRTPSATSPELYRRAPDRITMRIGFERFRKRVTKARKRLK